MDWRARITVDPRVLVGKPIVKGPVSRSSSSSNYSAGGWTVEQVLHEYDHLQPEDIQACLAYAGEVLKSERVYCCRVA